MNKDEINIDDIKVEIVRIVRRHNAFFSLTEEPDSSLIITIDRPIDYIEEKVKPEIDKLFPDLVVNYRTNHRESMISDNVRLGIGGIILKHSQNYSIIEMEKDKILRIEVAKPLTFIYDYIEPKITSLLGKDKDFVVNYKSIPRVTE